MFRIIYPPQTISPAVPPPRHSLERKEFAQMLNILWLAICYMLGAVPFGLVVAKVTCGIDPREAGSRNIGTTNVARLCGTQYGILVLALDILKGTLPVMVAANMSDSWFFVGLCALACVLGHMYSCWLGFTGGKGFATMIGAFLPLAFWPILFSVILCVVTIAASGYVSLGALMFGACLPIFLILSGNFGIALFAFIATFLLYWKHRENIDRLAEGKENPWRKKS